MGNKRWNLEEDNYLKEHWTSKTLKAIAKKLNRSEFGISRRARRLKLGGIHANRISMADIASIMNVQVYTIKRWVNYHGLKAEKVVINSKKMWHIELADLVDWLEQNQDRFDSRRIEHMALGCEPIWLRIKRKKDIKEGNDFTLKYWTNSEIEELKFLFKKGLTYQEIAKRIGRTKSAVSHKLIRIKEEIWL